MIIWLLWLQYFKGNLIFRNDFGRLGEDKRRKKNMEKSETHSIQRMTSVKGIPDFASI